MERSLSLKVLGPAFYRTAVEQRLAANAHVVSERPEVVLLLGDFWLAELQKLRRGASPGAVGIVLVADQRTDLLPAVRLGIEVFLDEDGSEAELHQALRAAAARSGYCSPSLMPGLLRHLRAERPQGQVGRGSADRLSVLSKREREVASCVGQGWRNEHVAQELRLSLATVKFHLSKIYAKLGLESRAELVAYLSQAPRVADGTPH